MEMSGVTDLVGAFFYFGGNAEPTGLEPATEINIKATEQDYLTFRDTFVTVLNEKITSTERTTTR